MAEENEKIGPEQNAQKFSTIEIDLIQKLIDMRKQSGQDLQYEKLEGYEIPPRTQFSMLNKPAVSIKNGQLNFNMACVRMFEGVKYILPIVNEEKHKLAVVPCQEEESCSIDWARKNKEDKWVNKQITNRDLVVKIGAFMKWDTTCRYKVLGEVRMSARGLILVFDLTEAIMFSPQHEEYIDEETGEKKIKKKDIKFYPDKYKGKIGMSYSDYAETRQMNLFEDFSNYFQADGGVVEDSGTDETAVVKTQETQEVEREEQQTQESDNAKVEQAGEEKENVVPETTAITVPTPFEQPTSLAEQEAVSNGEKQF
ncbi:MAG: hypothetical protein PHN80_08410 [Hespellia sp.]|nr:hypothetical protein [Hespellia sp.]